MDEHEFDRRAEEALIGVEAVLEANGIDFEWLPGGVLEIDLAEGGQIVIHRHLSRRELWVASRSGGFHFWYDGALWRDTRGGEDLFGLLSRLIRDRTGKLIVFNIPADS